ncbi:hypothetical protein OG259_16070 [Streptomyces sp. NBC_00250]|uniref:hypothetical protein n=1 Tax=Streptomyces sp. NBC_00250 TaxID=2903641 RepID=UPI002E2BD6CC|nr:hypothetical protein [Streptomyces sp. NBC_00250]
MNRPAPLRSPVALLTALALLCGALAAALALAVPAKAATVHGSFTLQGGSGSVTARPFATGVTTTAACPAPADPAKPYLKARLGVVEPVLGTFHAIAGTVPGDPLSAGPFTRPVDVEATHTSLQEGLRNFIPEGPLDGRYELRLYCRTGIGAESEDYFSTMIQVTGDTWAPIAQKATLLEVVSDPAVAVVGAPAEIIATFQPKEAAGSVSFQKFVNDELVDIGTVDVVGGKAQVTVTESAVNNDGLPVVVTFTPTDPEAYTPASFVYSLYVAEPTPTPTGTTPTPTGTTPTPTGTGTGTPTPTDDPTDTPTPTDTPSDTPSDTPGPTGTDTPSPTATGDSGTSGGSSGGDSGTSGGSGGSDAQGGSGDSGGSGTSGGSGGTGTDGGNGSLAATGSTAASAALGSLALCLLGAAAVIQTRRRKAGARP